MSIISRSSSDMRVIGSSSDMKVIGSSSLLFGKNCAVHQVLKVGTLSSQSTFSSFYLRGITHRHIDTFAIGHVVVASQQVV